MYRTITRIDEKALKEIKPFLILTSYKILNYIGTIAGFIYGGMNIYLKEYPQAIIGFLLGFIFFITPEIRANRIIKRHLQVTQEIDGKPYVDYEISFEDNGFEATNLKTNGSAIFKFEDIKKFEATENYFYLSTKANQFVLVDKRKLSQQDLVKLLKLLEKNLKHIRRKKK